MVHYFDGVVYFLLGESVLGLGKQVTDPLANFDQGRVSFQFGDDLSALLRFELVH